MPTVSFPPFSWFQTKVQNFGIPRMHPMFAPPPPPHLVCTCLLFYKPPPPRLVEAG